MKPKPRGWTVLWPGVAAVSITAVWLARRPSGSFFDISVIVAPILLLTSFALLWLPATLVHLLLFERAGGRSLRSVQLWIAVVFFLPSAWAVMRGFSTRRRDTRAEARRATERQSIHKMLDAANSLDGIREPLSSAAEDEVVSFITYHDMPPEVQLAAAARLGHSPRPLYALAMRRDLPAQAVSIMYDSSLTVPIARDASLTQRSCLDTQELNDYCLLWGRLAWLAPAELLHRMLNGPNAVIRGAAAKRQARDDSATAAKR